MLSIRSSTSPRTAATNIEPPNPQHLIECVSSATCIIGIFELFRQTFDEKLCTLSLAYSVYIASSIFLLQVQADPDDQQAMKKLEYCINTLQRSSKINYGKSYLLFFLLKQLC
jgi:hypothetical protein